MNFKKANGKRRVVVTGGGMLSALGRDWETVYKNLRTYKNKIRYMTEWDRYTRINTRLACPYDEPLPNFPRKKVRGMGRVALLSLVSTQDALKLAGLLNVEGDDVIPELKNGRTGIAYGTCMGSMDAISDLAEVIRTGDSLNMNSQTYIKAMPQTSACNLSVYYQTKGRIIVTDTACTSGSQAIGYGYETIEEGKQDIMICGGSEELSISNASIFDTLGTASIQNTSPELQPKCFDKNRSGLVIGEGAGTLILEDLEHALNRNAPIFCEIVGFATNTDGDHITSPNRTTQALCLKMALENAGLKSDQIGYINAHGTATVNGDISETQAVYDIFGGNIPISSTKSYIGHTLGACGAIESWITINMLNENWFHPTINLSNLDTECAPLDYITNKGRQIDTKYVMCNNFAFGGVNTSLIFNKWEY